MSAPEAGQRKRWPWWLILLAIVFWPFFLLWWIWERSSWHPALKGVLSAPLALIVVFGIVLPFNTPPSPRTPAASPAPRAETSPPLPSASPTSAAPAPSPSTQAPDKPTDPRSAVLKWQYFGDYWPLTIPEATVSCDRDAVVLTADGKKYALNGVAITRYKDMPQFRTSGIWRDNDKVGNKMNIGPFIDLGLDLCQGKTFQPKVISTASEMPRSKDDVPAAAPVGPACDAAFKAWEKVGPAVDPDDAVVMATLTKCKDVAEWRGGVTKYPTVLDHDDDLGVYPGALRLDLNIICGAGEPRETRVCQDAVKRTIVP